MSCEPKVYTTNVTDCCVLQILCEGAVVKEFLLSELRVIDKGVSFEIMDRVSGMDFSNATIDVTAEDVRALRCGCAQAIVGDHCDLSAQELALDGEETFNGAYNNLDPTDNNWYAYWSVDPGQATNIAYLDGAGINCFYQTVIFSNGYMVIYKIQKTGPATISITYINETQIV